MREIESPVTLAANLAGALHLAALGYPVFPKQANSKHEFSDKPERRDKLDYKPALTRKHATTDVSKIIEMFCDERLNVGYVVPAGRVIVDVDRERDDLKKLPEIGNTRVEQTADCNLHIAYVLPPHLLDVTGATDFNGIEIKLAGSVITGAGSVINGREYVELDSSDEADAPEWLVEAVERWQAQREVLTTKGQMQSPETVSDARGRRWGESALLGECSKVLQAPEGERFHVLQKSSFKVGQVVHFIGESAAREQLLCASRHYDNLRKVESVIESGLKAGALNPRYPTERTERATYRTALAEMTRLCDVSAWGGYMRFETKKKTGQVRATTVRGALSAILQIANAANRLELNLSQRFVAERAHMSKKTAWKVLTALKTMKLLELTEKSDGLETANKYRLTAKGFLMLQRASVDAKIGTQRKSNICLLEKKGDGAFAPVNFSSSLQTVDFLYVPIEGASHIGLFAHGTLGRSAFVVARSLASGEKTAAQIADSTGLTVRTVRAALNKMQIEGLVEREGQKSASWTVADDFAEQADRTATEFSTQARSTVKKFRHAKERKDWRLQIEQRRKERLQASSHEHFEQDTTGVIEPIQQNI